MFPKSRTCTGKVSGQALTEYPSEAAARDAVAYTAARHARSMVAYHCHQCRWWHLAPADRQTRSTTSSCTDHLGRSKLAYDSREDAERRAEIRRVEDGARLRVYSCNCGAWHLTSR